MKSRLPHNKTILLSVEGTVWELHLKLMWKRGECLSTDHMNALLLHKVIFTNVESLSSTELAFDFTSLNVSRKAEMLQSTLRDISSKHPLLQFH